MTKRTFKQLFVLFSVVLSVVFASNSFGQVTTTEGFESTTFAPTGWRISPIITGGPGGNQIWRRTSPAGTNPTANPYAGAAMARFDSRNNALGSTQTLVSPVIDYSFRASAATTVSLWLFRDDQQLTQADSLTLYINTVDTILGATRIGAIARSMAIALPNTEAAIGWYQYSFAVPTNFNSATNYLLIRGTSERVAGGGGGNTGRNIFIDEVSYASFPQPCSGTPNVGTIVKSSNVICGGSGSANLSLTNPINNLSGISYNWQSASNLSGPFTTIVGSTNSSTASTGLLSSPTTVVYYQCVVTCSASTLTYTTAIDSITISNATLPTVAVTPSFTALCSGTTTTLTASGANLTFTWASTNAGLNATSGATVTATPPVGGGFGGGTRTIVITGTDLLGCTDTAQAILQVSNSPNSTITSSIANDSICIGQTLVLTMPNIGGGPGGGGTYAWMPSGKTTRTDSIVGTTAGQIIVIGSVTSNASGCTSSDTVIVNVNSGTAPTVTVTPATATYCVGGVGVSLTATGTGTTFSWTPSATLNTASGSTVIATPAAGGPGGGTTVYTVTSSNGACSSSATATVTRSTPPALNATIYPITGNTALTSDTVCTGVMVRLNALPGGAGNNFTYLWSDGKTFRIDTITSSITTTFTVMATNTAGCVAHDTVTLVVVAGTPPTLTLNPTGPINLCNATPTTIIVSGATTYSWTPNNSGLNSYTNDTVIATPNNTTIYTVTGTTGKCFSTASITLNVGSTPVLNPTLYPLVGNNPLGTDTVCFGDTIKINAIPFGGNNPWTYLWNNGHTIRIDTAIITSSQTFTVIATDNNGCGTDTGIINVIMANKPIAKFSDTLVGTTAYFIDSSLYATGYIWDFGDTSAFDFTSNPTHIYPHNGPYYAILTVFGACGSSTDTVLVGIWGVGINTIAKNEIYSYPNPVKDYLNLSFKMNSNNAEMIIVNALGQIMESKTISSKSTNGFNEKVSMTNYPNGVYSIKVKSNKELLNIKVIKSNN